MLHLQIQEYNSISYKYICVNKIWNTKIKKIANEIFILKVVFYVLDGPYSSVLNCWNDFLLQLKPHGQGKSSLNQLYKKLY